MAKTIFEISALLSSPDDVREERELLEDTIRNLNIMLTSHIGKRIELVKWETHSCSNIGKDTQSNINEQIGEDYEIFIGIMWKKFGTPTPRADSGTAEEFERAYKRFQQNPKSIKIMFYFKEAVPSSMSEIDPYQWNLVSEFRKHLQEKGVLYGSFKTQTELQSLMYVHMSQQIFDWGDKWGNKREIIAEPLQVVSRNEAEIDESCIEDLIEICQNNFDAMENTSLRIADAIDSVGAKIKKRSEEIKDTQLETLNMRESIGDRMAEDIEGFISSMKVEIPLFAESYSEGLDALGHVTALSTISIEHDKQALIDVLKTVRLIRSSLMNALICVDRFRGVVAGSPLLSNRFNRAKRNAVTILDSFLSEISGACKTTSEIEIAIMATIDDHITQFFGEPTV